MRFIITSARIVEMLRQVAKKLKRKHSISHTEALDKAAKQHNYNHWLHVTWCEKETLKSERSLVEACADYVRSARDGKRDLDVLQHEGVTPLLLFSTDDGDAWLLDPIRQKGLCLCWRRETQIYTLRANGRAMEIDWDAEYLTTEDYGFSVQSTNPNVGTRVIAGYPIEDIERLEDQRFSEEIRQTIFGEGAEDVTDELVEELVRNGWSRETVEQYRAQELRYSRPRNTFLGPVLTNEDFPEDDDEPGN